MAYNALEIPRNPKQNKDHCDHFYESQSPGLIMYFLDSLSSDREFPITFCKHNIVHCLDIIALFPSAFFLPLMMK